MNQLQEKYRKRGLAIVGVTDESESKIKSFIDSRSIEYIVAIGNAPGYRSRGIPRSWLVDPKGIVVWEGHPSQLTDSLIEEHIKGARGIPYVELPRQLARAEKYINSGYYEHGMKELEKYLKRPKDEEVAETARETLEKLKKYGKEQLKKAEEYYEASDYVAAVETATALEKSFGGSDIGDEAESMRRKWLRVDAVRTELKAHAYLEKARELVREKRYKSAVPYLLKVLRTKSFASTRSRKEAQKLADEVEKKL